MDALSGTTAGFETDFDNLGYGVERVLEANRYTRVKIHLGDTHLTMERRTAKGPEANATYAAAAAAAALRDSGLGVYLTAKHGMPPSAGARGIKALRRRGHQGVIFDSDDPRSRDHLVEAAVRRGRPGTTSPTRNEPSRDDDAHGG